LLGEIHRAGIGQASLVVEAVGIGGLSLADLRLGAPPALTIEHIEVRYSAAGLWNGYLDELLVSGLRLRGSLGGDGLSLGALDALLEGDSEGDSEGFAGLPARRIVVADARANLEAPGGAVSLPFQVGIDDRGDGTLEGEASFELLHPQAEASGRASIAGAPDDFQGSLQIQGSPLQTPEIRIDSVFRAEASFQLRAGDLEARVELPPVPVKIGGGSLRAEGETPELELRLRQPADAAGFELGLTTRGGRMDLPEYGLSLAGIESSVRIEESGGEGSLRIGELRDSSGTAWVVPLVLRGRFERGDSAVDYRLKLTDEEEKLVLEARGSADPAAPSARAELFLRPIVWKEGGLQPTALFPFLEGQIQAAQGSVEALGSAVWDASGFRAEIDVALRELGFEAPSAEVSRVNGVIEVGGPVPPVTPPGQLISFALLDVGFELTDGLIDFQLRPDGLLELQEAEWRWAGAVVRTAGVVDPMADSQQLVLEVGEVALAEIVALIDLEGLEGSGTLSGEIPIFREGETVEIRGGELWGSPEGGRIRYRSATASEVLASQGSGVEQLRGALEDFHYDSLLLTVDGDTRGEADVVVQLGGSNPNYRGGRRVEFDLNVEARLADLLREGLVAHRVPEVIEKRLEEFQGPEIP
jgi:hypothetical protein